jgi:hypothetical protein
VEIGNHTNNTKTTSQPKPDPKDKAIVSLSLGIISAILNSFYLLIAVTIRSDLSGGIVETITEAIMAILEPLYLVMMGLTPSLFPLLFFVSVVGIILGIRGLKSSKGNLAKFGIVLCTLSLFFQGFYIFGVILPVLLIIATH